MENGDGNSLQDFFDKNMRWTEPKDNCDVSDADMVEEIDVRDSNRI